MEGEFLRHSKSINPMLLFNRAPKLRLTPDAIVLMSLGQLFLGGLVSTRARFRFADRLPSSAGPGKSVNRSAAGLPVPDEANYQLQGGPN